MDSYHAHYKAKYRYWPGLLLVLRFVVLLVFDFNFQENCKTNLLEIFWLWIRGGIYTNRYVNVLEVSFVLSLVVLTVVSVSNTSEENQLIVEQT